jgi:outer membrane protein TolC
MAVKANRRSSTQWRKALARRIISIALVAAGVGLEKAQIRAQVIFPEQAAAQDGLTLPIAVDIALRANPLIRAASSGRVIAGAQLNEARASRYPLVQLGETFARSNNPVFVFGSLLEQGRFGPQNFDPRFLNNPDSRNNLRTSLMFRLPLLDQRQSATRATQARIAVREADLKRDLTEQQVRFEALRAYWGVLVAQSKSQVADEAVKSAEADAKRISDMVQVGLRVASDQLSSEVQLSEFRQQQLQAEGDSMTAQAALNTALGLPVDEPQNVTGKLIEKTFGVVSQSELIRLALEHRPDLAEADLALKSSQEKTRGARGEYLPRVDVFGGYGVSGQNLTSGSADYTVGASVTFNLFDAGRAARLNQARAAEELAAAQAENLASQIRLEVVRAYQQFVAARGRVAVSARAVDQAREALRIVQDRYREGLTTITEVLRAETTYVRARMSALAATYDQYVGYANVLFVTGQLNSVDEFV